MVIVMPTFLILVAATITAIVYLIIRISRSRNRWLPNPSLTETQQQTVREEIVKKEVIVKVRCSYCGGQYDETLDKCPNCGAIH